MYFNTYRHKRLLPGLLFGLLLLACQPSREDKLTIATAANMQFAMENIIAEFTETTGIACETAISSSGKLTAQIEEGAPFDIFISADMKYPTRLFTEGLSLEEPKVYAYGKLVLWSMIDNLEPSIERLTDPEIHHVALANPKTAPYGAAAVQVLEKYQLQEALQAKMVYGESISQTNQFIISRAAELGFTAKSVVLSPQMKGKGKWKDIDMELYSPIAQGVVILKHRDQNLEAAKQFYDFLFSRQGKDILSEFGYEVGQEISQE
ncbi:molybdate ABC transporter substrate-binding protein [Flavilitoribacter nigricans]|uniref:Molybdate ABC transporter substrate-binding protein n=1 Tax=Flavilitoribacter nigricans (strain ATCC 23147 / DSM 23189 / NBRC 102662 / NCIMB 1420 / SS-2) TaxID=1122177 RepID=A0A2D0MYU0_FLAN2|nr:molybdate ABC transporter substrate-binding protein [Flavilitoribacter nigricans]PHN01298.1 molybdate ABC transporter substrate-binding protein [Flavilitoribacter nigricans DSM 23189 = NBRC 102662]